ncbi:MAG: aldo/keto reductase, partial [Christensenellales bacterium]|nr:aldo/keto reductase [Christensenellales bacterium]
MQYNELEKLGERVSRLGFGCMRFPTTPEGGIDEPRAEAMLDSAYRAGVNYFDTAYFYHQHTSEAFVGRMMKKYPRDSFRLATKMPMSIVTSLDQA